MKQWLSDREDGDGSSWHLGHRDSQILGCVGGWDMRLERNVSVRVRCLAWKLDIFWLRPPWGGFHWQGAAEARTGMFIHRHAVSYCSPCSRSSYVWNYPRQMRLPWQQEWHQLLSVVTRSLGPAEMASWWWQSQACRNWKSRYEKPQKSLSHHVS